MADGSIIIDTKIDNSGVKSGERTIKKTLSGIQKSFQSAAGNIAKSNDLIGSSLTKQNESIKKQEILLESLKRKYADITNGSVAEKKQSGLEKQLQGVQKEISKTEQEYNAMIQKLKSLEAVQSAGSPISQAQTKSDISKLDNSIMITGERLDELHRRASVIEKDLKSLKMNPENSEEAKKLKSEIELATQKLQRLKSEAKENFSEKPITNISKKVNESTNQIGKSIGRIGTRIRGLIMSAALFSVLYKAFNSLFTYMRTAALTNAQFSASLAQIKGNLLTAFQPIYEAVMPALNTLMQWLAKATAYIAAFVSAIFGKSVVASKQNAKALYNQAKAYGATGKAAKKAGKEAEKSTASFDELNIISENKSSDSSGGGGGIAPDFSMGDIDTTPIDAFMENLKNGFENFKQWWDENFKPIFDNIFENMRPQIDTFKTTISQIFSDMGTLGQPLKDWFNNNFTPFLQTVAITLGNIVVGVFDSFNKVFADIWNIVLFPVFQKLSTVILPMVTDFATQVILTFGTLFDNAKIIFDMLWSQAVAPALSLIVSIWSDAWTVIDSFWQKWGIPIFESIREAINKTGEVLVVAWNSLLKPVWDAFMETVDWLWSSHIKPLLDNFLDFVGELINCALIIYNNVIAPIVSWLVDILGPIWANTFQTILSVAGSVIGTICDIINGLVTVLKGIVQFISGVFSGDWGKAWKGVKNIFEGIWNMFGGIIKGVINIIIDLVNRMLRLIENAVNGITDGINAITGIVGIPAIPDLVIPKIPKLAQGSVVPPNREFLALLGDNKKETEVVSPLSTMKQALAEVMEELSGAGGNTVVLELDGREVGRVFLPLIRKEERRKGVQLGGVY